MRRASRSRALRRTTRRRSPRRCSRSVASLIRSASSWACTSARRRSMTAMSPSSLDTSAPRRATSPARPRSRARAWSARWRRSPSLCAPERLGTASAAATAASAAAMRASLQARVMGRRRPGGRRSYQRLRVIPGGGLQVRAPHCGRALPAPRRGGFARRRAAAERPRDGPGHAARHLRARPVLRGDLRLLRLQPRRAGRRRRPRRLRARGARRGAPRAPRPGRAGAGGRDGVLRRRHADAPAGRPARRDTRRDQRDLRARRRRGGDGRGEPGDGRAGHARRAPGRRLHADLARDAERPAPRPGRARPPPHARRRGRRGGARARRRLRARLARPHLRHAGRDRRRLGGVGRGGPRGGGRPPGRGWGGGRDRAAPAPAPARWGPAPARARGTRLPAHGRAGALRGPDDEAMARRYRPADALLGEAGLGWYEISNWAAHAGARCRHNLAYWRSENWWGLGPGAHSHVGGVRWWNVLRPRAYAERLTNGVSPAAACERLTAAERRTERIMLELRLAEGLALGDAERAAAQREAVAGRLDADALEGDGRAVLTLDGRLMGDAVARALVG